MKHSVLFENCENHWDNALPLGNGTLGCMLFYEKNQLHMPMNHYEVYYTGVTDIIQPEDLEAPERPEITPGQQHMQFLQRADANRPPEGEPFCLYRTDRILAFQKKPYGITKFSGSYPTTGELVFSFSDKLCNTKENPRNASGRLALYLEDAKTELTLQHNTSSLSLETLVTRRDCILQRITQSEPGLLSHITIAFPAYRDTNRPEVQYDLVDSQTVRYHVSCRFPHRREFHFAGVLRFIGAAVTLQTTDSNAVLTIKSASDSFSLLTVIATDWRHDDPADAALQQAFFFEMQLPQLRQEHAAYWQSFFTRSSISLPDPFLEKIYYINQYALDCCSGRDGVMKHHACGLNGLWAIRHPNLWGSMWYWDVNIQAAFAGVFSSNRLELGKVFSDGLLSYRKLARRFAREVHNLPGCASDYPYHFYYSCWTWCAQYLWFLYEYSLDKEYLRTDAYPLFLELCEFTLGIFTYDEASDTYTVYPDISPEQGPLAHNTTITVACAKYLLQFTLEAATILEDHSPLLPRIQTLLTKLPSYPLSRPGKYGVHLKDSPDAPDNLWIRHPSMLMPVFPIGEYDLESSDEMKQLISNTIDFLEDNCEIGIFGCSWIAAAAARIGRGQTALRILYEKGIDHLLRSNGLTAEATDRFMNYCLITRQPLYYPCMMEFSGEMLAAVNEMLLQSQNHLIRIFPALPDGDPEYGRMLRNGYSISDYTELYRSYAAWKDVRFDNLLAKGAFEVSAQLQNGNLKWVLVHSKKGGRLRLTSDYFSTSVSVFVNGNTVNCSCQDGIYELDTISGTTYLFADSADAYVPKDVRETNCSEAARHLPSATANGFDSGISCHRTYTRRDISIGDNSETLYHKKLDGFLRDWYLGNARMANHTVYKFDFTEQSEKDYQDILPIQAMANQGGHLLRGMDFVRLGAQPFTEGTGFGFRNAEGISMVLRNAPDVLRCDFAEGTADAEFIIEAPRGQYELLLISGDTDEDSVTVATCDNSRRIGGSVIPKGCFQCELIPIIQEYDEPIRIHLSTRPGYRWKLNALLLNVVKGY